MLLGGSPLRLFRISERARQLVARWRAGASGGAGPGGPAVGAPAGVGRRVRRRDPTAATLGPGDVTVVVPVRDRPAQLDRLLGALRRAGLRRGRRRVGRRGRDQGDRRAARRALRRAARPTPARPAPATRGWPPSHSALVAFVDSDCVPDDGWLGPLLGHFDDPLVAAVAPRIVPAPGPGQVGSARYDAARSSLDRGPGRGRCAPGSPIPFVPSAALLVRVDAATGPDLFDAALRGGEDVDLVWRLGEAGWDVRYVPSSTVAHDGPGDAGVAPGAPGLLRDDGRAAGPPPRGRAGPGPRLRLVAGGVGPRCWPAGPCSPWPRWPRPSPSWPAACAASCATPSAWPRTSRAAAPCAAAAARRSASLTRAWSPALVLGLAFRRTRRGVGAGAARPRAGRLGRRPAGHRPGARRRRPRRRRRRLRHRASGSAAPGSGRSCRSSRGSRGAPGSGRRRALRDELRPPSARPATHAARRRVGDPSGDVH